MDNGLKLTNTTLDDFKKFGGDSLTTVVEALLGDPIAIAKIPELAISAPFFISNSLYMMKFEKLLNGIYFDSADKIKISYRLFGEDTNERVDNAIRALTLIDKIDSLTKIEYLLNANRSFCNECISREQLFRIANFLAKTLSEDIEYLKKHATDDELSGSANVHSLANVGAVILGGIDGNADAEKQTYIVTEFGRIIDQYALSVMDDKRQEYYKARLNRQHTFDAKNGSISDDEIDKIENGAADKARPRWNEC